MDRATQQQAAQHAEVRAQVKAFAAGLDRAFTASLKAADQRVTSLEAKVRARGWAGSLAVPIARHLPPSALAGQVERAKRRVGEQARRFTTERQALERELKAARAEAALATSLRDAAESDAVAAAEARARKAATEAAGLRDELAVAIQARRQALSDLALVSVTKGGSLVYAACRLSSSQATEASERRLRDEVARVRREADEKLRTAATTESDLKVRR